jgi:hypothetical protein
MTPFWKPRKETTPLDEVVEVISLPAPRSLEKNQQVLLDAESIELDPTVVELIREYVSLVERMYRQENDFHCFEHASHVSMSIAKLLSRIPQQEPQETADDHTYGIPSDPLTRFACVFSALIHDVGHPGVTNMRLVQEKDRLALNYKGMSIAEQNSVDLAWNLLMNTKFEPLVSTICRDTVELARFRQLVVNSVMATDISDKNLNNLRRDRWDKAFSEPPNTENQTVAVNRKATIMIEHLMQAADMSHTMQHWNVYQKWNARLFKEMYKAYIAGRSSKDPSEFWYQGELDFFDSFVIPLATKLVHCGVFAAADGASSEYVQYATQNRNEWEQKGKSVVLTLVARVKRGSSA